MGSYKLYKKNGTYYLGSGIPEDELINTVFTTEGFLEVARES